MTDFQKLLLIKILRNEYLISSIRDYVISQMGVKFIKPTGFDLHEFYDGSNCRTPLIFILSPGMSSKIFLLLTILHIYTYIYIYIYIYIYMYVCM